MARGPNGDRPTARRLRPDRPERKPPCCFEQRAKWRREMGRPAFAARAAARRACAVLRRLTARLAREDFLAAAGVTFAGVGVSMVTGGPPSVAISGFGNSGAFFDRHSCPVGTWPSRSCPVRRLGIAGDFLSRRQARRVVGLSRWCLGRQSGFQARQLLASAPRTARGFPVPSPGPPSAAISSGSTGGLADSAGVETTAG